MPRTRRPPQTRLYATFTLREREILRAREQGQSYRTIGARLGVTPARVAQIAENVAKRLAEIARAEALASRTTDPLDTPVLLLPLSTRAINALRRHGKQTLRDLAFCQPDELIRMKNLGATSVHEIQAVVRRAAAASRKPRRR